MKKEFMGRGIGSSERGNCQGWEGERWGESKYIYMYVWGC